MQNDFSYTGFLLTQPGFIKIIFNYAYPRHNKHYSNLDGALQFTQNYKIKIKVLSR